MSYHAPCDACGAEARIHGKADARVCAACDEVNRVVVLVLARIIRAVDHGLSDFLVITSGYPFPSSETSPDMTIERRSRASMNEIFDVMVLSDSDPVARETPFDTSFSED